MTKLPVQIHHSKPSNPKASLLYLMGGTWKYKTMFGSAFTENNFESILNSYGIETYAIDYEKGDTFIDVVTACRFIKTNYTMGYSLGCMLALACVHKDTKGLILLDPQSVVDHNQHKYISDINTANAFFDTDIANKNHNVNNTLNFDIINFRMLNTVKTLFLFSQYGNDNNYLETDKGLCFNSLRNKHKVVIPNSSHYLLLEPTRFDVAKAIKEWSKIPCL